MRIPAWMITEEMKQTEHYRMYAEVFGQDVPLTQLQPTESTQGTHRTTSTPRSPNPITEAAELSAPKRSTVIRFRLSERRSTRSLHHQLQVPTADKCYEMLLQDRHDSSPPRNDDTTIPGTRLELRSDKESSEVEITKEKEVEIMKETEVEFVAKTLELTSDKASPEVEITKENEEDITNIVPLKLYELTVTHTTPSSSSPHTKFTKTNRLLSLLKTKPTRFKRYKKESSMMSMAETKTSMIKDHVTKKVMKQVPEQIRDQVPVYVAKGLILERQKINEEIPSAVRLIDQEDLMNDAHPELRIVQRGRRHRNTNKSISQEHMEEISLTIDEAKLIKIADEMLRQRCTSRDEHQYHIDQMKNFLQSDIVWESKKEILDSPHPRNLTPLVLIIKTYWELGHEHKFITEIVARRANDCIVSITEPDYKNLNKNDIEDIYLLIMNGKVPDYADTGLLWSLSVFIRSSVIWERVHDFQLGIESYQQKVNLTAPTMTFPGIEEYEVFSIVYEPVHGIIYKNSKKEKRVMRHSEIHKFCDATLMRVLEGLKSYNNDVKYGYVQKELTSDEVEYLKLFEEEIEVRLKYQNQMRRWEMYVNGRPLGPRRERPE
ncbi:hypothetical protein Tco_0693764 [Tanacetum coccineum]